ncbi:hypothetical protein G4D82_00490 [Flavobacterium sp. CYK-4]|nr:hypothetical protein [Flavobacterium lotistagni]NHM05686.1 hypothetical protein [Flavobacterium lotistagni]
MKKSIVLSALFLALSFSKSPVNSLQSSTKSTVEIGGQNGQIPVNPPKP